MLTRLRGWLADKLAPDSFVAFPPEGEAVFLYSEGGSVLIASVTKWEIKMRENRVDASVFGDVNKTYLVSQRPSGTLIAEIG